MMTKRYWIKAAAVLLSLSAAASAAEALDYPQRPIKIIVDRPAGVPHDLLTRALAEKLSARLGQPSSWRTVRAPAAMSQPSTSPVQRRMATRCWWRWIRRSPSIRPSIKISRSIRAPLLRPLSIMAQNSNMLVVHRSVPVNSCRRNLSPMRKRSRSLMATAATAAQAI